MLEQLNASHFSACLNQSFVALLADSDVVLELVEITIEPLRPSQTIVAHGRELTIRPDPFSVRFCGPHQPALPQQIYTLNHPTLSIEDIFLVPVGIDEKGRYYEAVFN